MQNCMRCKTPLKDGDVVMTKCPATFEQFSETVHRIQPIDIDEIWCNACDDMESDD